jgi:hypothetical protein
MAEVPASSTEVPGRLGPGRQLAGYFLKLWRGEFPLARVFWTDLIVVGTVVNLLVSAAAMLLFVSGAPIALGVIVHFAPVPYNILLFLAVWQAAARETSVWSFAAQAAAMLWLVTAIVV